MNEDRITTDFTFAEFERRDTARLRGIDNTIPGGSVRQAVRLLVLNVLQPLRDALGKPVYINSGYRCPALNAAVGGVPDSQHTKGEAADISASDPLLIAQSVLRNGIPFDQMILYSTFVHISYRASGPQRGQILYDSSYRNEYPKATP